MKIAGPLAVPLVTTKSVGNKKLDPLKTMPVGAPGSSEFGGPGIATTSGRIVPSGSYNVEVPEPLFDDQNTPFPLGTSPHGFLRFESR